MAVMMLEEKKQLTVHDKLSRYIPDYPEGDRIEILHLLTHTSGIPDHTELADFDRERRVFPYDVAQTIDTFKNKPLEFSPGEKFKYSNSGYILLGYIIEKVAQMPYGEFIEQKILRPLSMKDSGFENTNEIIKHCAYGYSLKSNEVIKAKYRDISNAHASGALYSTVEDLYLWDRALYTERLIGKNALERMFTPFKDHYGYGWGVVDIFNRKMVAHNGETEGFRANISRFVDDEVCIIVMSNMEHTPIGRISIDLAAIVFGEEYSIPEVRQVVNVNPDILREYAGEYEIKPGFSLTITEENGRLFCQATGQDKLEVYPESETVFFLKVVDARISFIIDENDEVEKLILHQGGRDVPAARIRTDR
jgi:CubicO group peptidase (beta-lactamase class C family)